KRSRRRWEIYAADWASLPVHVRLWLVPAAGRASIVCLPKEGLASLPRSERVGRKPKGQRKQPAAATSKHGRLGRAIIAECGHFRQPSQPCLLFSRAHYILRRPLNRRSGRANRMLTHLKRS